MRGVVRRVNRLEQRLGYENGERKKGMRFVVLSAATRMAIDPDGCVELLEEYGFLPSGKPGTVIDLHRIPNGLDVEETKQFLREHGAELCSLGEKRMLGRDGHTPYEGDGKAGSQAGELQGTAPGGTGLGSGDPGAAAETTHRRRQGAGARSTFPGRWQ